MGIDLSNPYGAISGSEWSKLADTHQGWIVENWVPYKGMLLLVGRSGAGKSPLLYQMAFCVAAGLPFVGQAVQKGTTLICDYENSQSGITALLEGFSDYFDVPIPPNLIIVSATKTSNLGLNWNLLAIEHYRPSLGIIDTLGNACPELEDKNVNARTSYNLIRQTITKTNSSIAESHHVRKKSDDMMAYQHSITNDETRKNAFQQVRGAGAIVDGSDVRLILEEVDNDHVAVGGYARLEGDIPPIYLERKYSSTGKPMAYERCSVVQRPLDEAVLQALRRVPKEFSFTQIKEVWGKAGPSTMLMLKKAIRAGVVTKVNGQYVKQSTI